MPSYPESGNKSNLAEIHVPLKELAGIIFAWDKRRSWALVLSALLALGANAAWQAPIAPVFLIFFINFLCFLSALGSLAAGLVSWAFWLPLVNVNLNVFPGFPTLSFDKVAFLLMLAAWRFRVRREFLVSDPITRAFAGLLAAGFLTLAWNRNNLLGQLVGLGEYASYLSIYLIAVGTLKPQQDRSRMLAALIAGCAVATALAYGEYLVYRISDGKVVFSPYYEWNLGARDTQFGGTVGHKNFFAAYQSLMIFVSLAVLLSRKGNRYFFGGLLFLQALTLSTGKSLGAFVGLPAGLLAWSAMRYSGEKRLLAFLVVSVGAILLLVSVFALVNPRIPHRKLSGSIQPRLYLHRVALEAWASRPLLGHGVGSFPSVISASSMKLGLQEMERFGLNESHAESLWRGGGWSAHSVYLKAAVETGVIGLLALLGLGHAVAHTLLAGAKKAGGVFEVRMCEAVFCGLISFSIQGFTEELLSFSKLSFIYFIVVGLATSFPRVLHTGSEKHIVGEMG